MFHRRTVSHGVGVAFTDRHGGVSPSPYDSLNLGRSDRDDPQHVVANLQRVRAGLGLPEAAPIVTVRQEHTTTVVRVDHDFVRGWTDESTVGDALAGQPRLILGDALITNLPEVVLCIRVADCLPIVLAQYDDEGRGAAVAAVHAGRAGLAGGIVPAAVHAIRDLAANPSGRVVAWIGPHVCGACYEVPATMRDEVADLVPGVAATTSWGTPSLDLGAGASRQLRDLDCEVSQWGDCTRTSPDLFSHRRDGDQSGRIAGLAWLTSH